MSSWCSEFCFNCMHSICGKQMASTEKLQRKTTGSYLRSKSSWGRCPAKISICVQIFQKFFLINEVSRFTFINVLLNKIDPIPIVVVGNRRHLASGGNMGYDLFRWIYLLQISLIGWAVDWLIGCKYGFISYLHKKWDIWCFTNSNTWDWWP